MNEDNEGTILGTGMVKWIGAMIKYVDGRLRRFLLSVDRASSVEMFGAWDFLQGGREPPLPEHSGGLAICLYLSMFVECWGNAGGQEKMRLKTVMILKKEMRLKE